MRLRNLLLALLPMAMAMAPQVASAQSVYIYTPEVGPTDSAAALEFTTIICHANRPGDMENWLFEHLMDRYNRALDLRQSGGDPVLEKVIDSEDNSIRSRLQIIANHHAPLLFQATLWHYSNRIAGINVRAMLSFAQSDAGKKYFSWDSIPDFDSTALAAMLSDNSRLADDIIAELSAKAPEAMARHPELARKVIIAGGALR